MERAYSLLTIKAVDEAQRVIEGIASTPETDLVGDQLMPLGARFKLPLPLLWQHQHDQPIGFVEAATPTSSGITFRARLARVTEPGLSEALKNRLDEAWAAIKIGLVKGVSVGFQAIKVEPISTGIRFVEWSWHELSAVTIPANTDASITAVKAAFAASIRSDETPPSSLWREVWDAGQRGMDELRSKPGYEQADVTARMAAEARMCGMEMAKALAARIENLERHTVEYAGVWSEGRQYRRGHMVTFHGSIWHANEPTAARPGEGSGWQLAVRKGRDAKDCR